MSRLSLVLVLSINVIAVKVRYLIIRLLQLRGGATYYVQLTKSTYRSSMRFRNQIAIGFRKQKRAGIIRPDLIGLLWLVL